MGYEFHEHGRPTIDETTCIGCGKCSEFCIGRVLVLEDKKARVDGGNFMGCVACGHCVAICPTSAITVEGRGMKSDDRRTLPAKDIAATPGQLEALLLRRRSIRRFKEQEVDRATLQRILEIATTAPMGIPPADVSVTVVAGREKMKVFTADAMAVFKKMSKMMKPAALFLMGLFKKKTEMEMMREFIVPLLKSLTDEYEKGNDYFAYDAPVMLLFHYSPYSDATNLTIAATYAVIAAEACGLGSCMIGTVDALNYDKQFKKKYGIPEGNKIGVSMILGHPAVEFKSALHRRFQEIRWM